MIVAQAAQKASPDRSAAQHSQPREGRPEVASFGSALTPSSTGSVGAELFGQRVGRLRKELGFSTSELAKRANVTRQAIWKWENRDGYPTFASLQLLADAIGVSVAELVAETDLEDAYAQYGWFYHAPPGATNWLPIGTFFDRRPLSPIVILWTGFACCGFFDDELKQWHRLGDEIDEGAVLPTHWQPLPREPHGY